MGDNYNSEAAQAEDSGSILIGDMSVIDDFKDELRDYLGPIFNAFTSTADGRYSYITDIKTDVTALCDEFVEYFGFPDKYLHRFNDVWRTYINPEQLEYFDKTIEDLFTGTTAMHDATYMVRNKEGFYVTITCKGKLVKDRSGENRFFVGNIVNHERENFIDPVTGLYSRNNLMKLLGKYEAQHKKFYLCMFGVKDFFEINNTYGIHAGNMILKSIASQLTKLVRSGYVYRAEGTKMAYLVLQSDIELDTLKESFDRLRAYLKNSFEVGGTHISIDYYGACMLSDGSHVIGENAIYNNAMSLLNQAKENTFQHLYVVDAESLDKNNERLQFLSRIRSSVLHGCAGFYLLYQPIVNAGTEEVVGAEALLRWQDASGKTVPPGLFIPWLEKDPVFYTLGNWIIRTALHEVHPLLAEHPDFVVNVNLAYPQLANERFKSDLEAIIKQENFPTRNVKLELTERCKLLNPAALQSDVIFLKSRNFNIALDDFGTGYSALDVLMKLPVNQIKIDKSFIDDIQADMPKQYLLKAITGYAKDLEKGVCIEGIETKDLACYLRENYHVSQFQGYYYSKPVRLSEIRF